MSESFKNIRCFIENMNLMHIKHKNMAQLLF
jgi:hypothetical protein